ncbi:MAG: NAD-dependent epimerase/dehydratase family protein [Nitrososphaerota archaeon]|nr:NAD-dependent epimerase/dehydratase family protein [Nitrososphaerota archaeon]MDG7042744.1 NAD-dependent epimerase/dehydratase family protein [Nitrososphaerota archaeon]
MSILVTGGAGFIGSNLVEALAKDNSVTVLDNFHTGSMDNLAGALKGGDVEVIRMDVKDVRSLNKRFDLVYHLGIYSSAPMYREDPGLVGEVIDGMVAVLEYCRSRGSTLVFASTSSIYSGLQPPHREDMVPRVTDFYTEARISAERLANLYAVLYGVNSAAMRFFSVYGYHEGAKGRYANLITQFLLSMKRGEAPVVYGDGSQRRDFTFVTDVVDALLRASSVKGFAPYNVGTGVSYTINDMIDRLNRALGTAIRAKYVPMPVANYVMETLADTGKAEKELGFRARVSLDEGIARLAGST